MCQAAAGDAAFYWTSQLGVDSKWITWIQSAAERPQPSCAKRKFSYCHITLLTGTMQLTQKLSLNILTEQEIFTEWRISITEHDKISVSDFLVMHCLICRLEN